MADGIIVHVPRSNLLIEAVHAQKPFPLAEVVSAIEKQVRNTQALCRRAAEAQFFQPGCPVEYDRPLPPASN